MYYINDWKSNLNKVRYVHYLDSVSKLRMKHLKIAKKCELWSTIANTLSKKIYSITHPFHHGKHSKLVHMGGSMQDFLLSINSIPQYSINVVCSHLDLRLLTQLRKQLYAKRLGHFCSLSDYNLAAKLQFCL